MPKNGVMLHPSTKGIDMSVQSVELPLLFYAWRRKVTGNVAPHQHGGCELIYVLDGHCRVESPAGIFEGTPGKLLVIPPEVIHNQIDDPGEDNIFCVFQANPALFAQHWRSLDLGGETRTIRMFLELCDMTEKNDLTGASAELSAKALRFRAETVPLHPTAPETPQSPRVPA